jgi:hypothetical protein
VQNLHIGEYLSSFPSLQTVSACDEIKTDNIALAAGFVCKDVQGLPLRSLARHIHI